MCIRRRFAAMVPAVTRPLRILLVDDDDDVREMLTLELASAGYAVDAAASGAEALSRARSTPPDLLLLDFQMPGMDGGEVIDGVRATSRLRTLPVVLVTAAASVPADTTIGFLRKPVHLEVLLRVVGAFAADAADGSLLGRALRAPCARCTADAGVWCASAGRLADRLHIERLAATTSGP